MAHTLKHFKEYKKNFHVPSADFNPARNKAVIDETFKEADAYHKSFGKALEDSLGQRYEVIASYGDYRLNRGNTKGIKEYLGDKLYTELVGEKLLEKLRVMKAVDRFGRKPILL